MAVSSLLRGTEISFFFLSYSLGETVYMIHFAEIVRIMTSIRHESSSSCKLEMHRNLAVAGSMAELCSLRCHSS